MHQRITRFISRLAPSKQPNSKVLVASQLTLFIALISQVFAAQAQISETSICFTNPNNYASPTVHLWNAVPTASVSDTTWPGHPLTAVGNAYCYDPGVALTSISAVFSDSGVNKTNDLSMTSPNQCYTNGSWQALSACEGGTGSSAVPRTAFVHLFEWKWTDIAKECEVFLGPKGFSAVQVSPPTEHIQGNQWWTRYQPVSYKLESRGGTREEFIDMVNRCDKAGVGIYVDAVINHMAGGSGTGVAGTAFSAGVSYPDYSSTDFNQPGCGIRQEDYKNDAQRIRNCGLPGLPDLATGKEYVRATIAAYMNDLIGIGVKGFRLDASKHMWPADVQNIISRLNGEPYIFQEVIDLGGEAVSSAEYTPLGNVTEFKYAGKIGETFKKGQLKNVENFGEPWGFMSSSSAVVFTDNHDNQRGHGAGGENILTYKDAPKYDLANVFMLAWPYGYPKIMSSYQFTDTEIAGPNSSIHGGADVNCFNEWKCEHRWRGVANAVAFRNHTLANWRVTDWWSNGDNQIAFGRGNLGYVAINHQANDLTREFKSSLPAGTYCNTFDAEFNETTGECSGERILVSANGSFSATVEANTALMIHVGAVVGKPTIGGHGNTGNTKLKPRANAGSDISIAVGETADFNASASTDPDGNIVSYRWDNGLSGTRPSLKYTQAGTYSVVLTVTDNDGLTATDSVRVTVTGKTTVTETEICFDNQNSFTTPTIYLWAPQPTSIAVTEWPGFVLVKKDNFYCRELGVKPTALNVIFSDSGLSKTEDLVLNPLKPCFSKGVWKSFAECGLNLANQPPIANAGADITVEEGQPVTFDASASSDPDGSIQAYSWSNGLSGVTATRSYPAAGSYNVVLTVTDNEGLTAKDSVLITVTKPIVYNYPNGRAVFYHNANKWPTVTAHMWNAAPAGASSDTIWPGTVMSDFGGLDLVFVELGQITSGRIIFSNQGNNKTLDLDYSGNKLCYKNATWVTLAECGVQEVSLADAGSDRSVNQGSVLALSAAASKTNTDSAVWTSDAWSGSLSGPSVVTPELNTQGNFTVKLTLAGGHSDEFKLSVVQPTQGLAERPKLATPLKFPLSGKVDNGNYQYVEAFPLLKGYFDSPVMVTNDGVNQNLIYVVDKTGKLLVFPNDPAVTPSQVVSLLDKDFHKRVRNYNEQGLLSVAFHPNFITNRLIYLYYVEHTGSSASNENEKGRDEEWNGVKYDDAVLIRLRLNDAINPSSVEANSIKEVLRIPSTNPDHKGGMMAFHPSTGDFFMSIGEMGYGDSATTNPTTGLGRVNANAQDLTTLAGSFIRITMSESDTPESTTNSYYTIPADNPFVGRGGGVREEIWSYGHRNPWRWAFDPVADLSEKPENQFTLWQGEVGQDGDTRYEEVNIIRKGGNYGWPICEGTRHRAGLGGDHNRSRQCSGDLIEPYSGYGNEGGVSIIGGLVYRGNKLSALKGKFIFGDYFTKKLWTIEKGQQKQVLSNNFPAHLSSFGTDVSGEEVFISTHGVDHGAPTSIYRMELDQVSEAAKIPTSLSETGIFADLTKRIPAHGVIEYGLNSDGWFDGAIARHFIAVPNDKTISTSDGELWDLPVGSVLIKHLELPTSASNSVPFETSVLFKQESGNWEAANYAWNTAGTDAVLVTETEINIAKQQWLDGKMVTVNKRLRAGSSCGGCHRGDNGKAPRDMETRQLNTVFDYPGKTDNQIDVFSAVGLLTGTPATAAFVDPADTSADLHQRALVYLDTNCSGCHFGGANGEGMDHRYDTPFTQRNFDQNSRLLPFDYAASGLYTHQTSDRLRMPLESTLTNPVADSLFKQWISAEDIKAQGPVRSSLNSSAISQVVPGTNIQFSFQSIYSNGFQLQPTSAVTWTSSAPSTLALSGSSGMLTAQALQQGTAIVTAVYNSGAGSAAVNTASTSITVSSGPISPTEFKQTGTASDSTLQLVWRDNATDELNYVLSRASSEDGSYLVVATLPADTTQFIDRNLQADTKYYYRLIAKNASGESQYLSTSARTGKAVVIDGIEIVTGTTLRLLGGEQRQAVAVATIAGDREAATMQAAWTSSDTNVVTVDAGLITGGNTAGTAVIRAEINGVFDSISVENLGAGEYVYLNKPSNWEAANIYLWREQNGQDIELAGTWPGVAMEPSIEYGGQWYRYPVLDKDIAANKAVKVVFNCGSDACKTLDLDQVMTSPRWFSESKWITAVPQGGLTEGGTQIQVVRGQVVFSGSENLSGAVFPVGATLTLSADPAAPGQKFNFWQGSGSELMVDPNSPTTRLVIDGKLSYSFAAIYAEIDNKHRAARELYNSGQLCSGCHGVNGDSSFGSLGKSLTDYKDYQDRQGLISIIENGMPLGNPAACTGSCASSIADMIIDGEIPKPVDVCDVANLTPQDRSYRLLTTEEYNNSIRDLFGLAIDANVNVTESVPADIPANGFFTNANMLFSSNYAAGYITAATKASELSSNIYSLVSCQHDDVNCFIDEFAKKAYRRPLSPTEKNQLLTVHAREGDKALLTAILSSPSMLLRSEMGNKISSNTGVDMYQLTDYEIATFLAYTYWASTPDSDLLAKAERGELHTQAQIKNTVTEMLKDPRAERVFKRFILGWLGLEHSNPVPDSDLSPAIKEAMIEETIMMVKNAVFTGLTYNELMTANYSFMNQALANHYGIEWPVGASGWQRIEYPQTGPNSERRGLLGHGSILSVNSAGQKTHPVRRGLFVRRSLMCQDFGAPPLGASLNPEVRDDQTVRQRFEIAHAQAGDVCSFCHQHIDGIGFAFENYTPLGLWTTTEVLGNGTSVEIDSSGEIGNLDSIETVLIDKEPTTPFQGIDELADLIAQSSNGKACYARQWYRYARGQHENAEDSCTLQSYASEFKSDANSSLLQLMINYTQTSNFGLRK